MKITTIKCDHCGEIYDPDRRVNDSVNVNGTYPFRLQLFAVPENSKHPEMHGLLDLCPSCRSRLADWWDSQ